MKWLTSASTKTISALLAILISGLSLSSMSLAQEPTQQPLTPLLIQHSTPANPSITDHQVQSPQILTAQAGVLPALGMLALRGQLSHNHAMALTRILTKAPPYLQKIAISALLAGASAAAVITLILNRQSLTNLNQAQILAPTYHLPLNPDQLIIPAHGITLSEGDNTDRLPQTNTQPAAETSRHNSPQNQPAVPPPALQIMEQNEHENKRTSTAAETEVINQEIIANEIQIITQKIESFPHSEHLLAANNAEELLTLAPSITSSQLQARLAQLKNTKGIPLFNQHILSSFWNRTQLYNFIHLKIFSTLEMHLFLSTILKPPVTNDFNHLAAIYNRDPSSLKIIRAIIIQRMMRHHIQLNLPTDISSKSPAAKIRQAFYQLTPEYIRWSLEKQNKLFNLSNYSEKDWHLIRSYHLAQFFFYKKSYVSTAGINQFLKILFDKNQKESPQHTKPSTITVLRELHDYLLENNIISNALWEKYYDTPFSQPQIDYILATQNALAQISPQELSDIGEAQLKNYGSYLTLPILREFLISLDNYPLLETILLSQVLQLNPISKLEFANFFKIPVFDSHNLTHSLKQNLEQFISATIAPQNRQTAQPLTSVSTQSTHQPSAAAPSATNSPAKRSSSASAHQNSLNDPFNFDNWLERDTYTTMIKILQSIDPNLAIHSITHTPTFLSQFNRPIEITTATYLEFINHYLNDGIDVLIFIKKFMEHPQPLIFQKKTKTPEGDGTSCAFCAGGAFSFDKIAAITGITQNQARVRFLQIQLNFYSMVGSQVAIAESYPISKTWATFRGKAALDILVHQLNYQNLTPDQLLPIIRNRLKASGYTFNSQLNLNQMIQAHRKWEQENIQQHYHWQAYIKVFLNMSPSYRFARRWKVSPEDLRVWVDNIHDSYFTMMSPYIVRTNDTNQPSTTHASAVSEEYTPQNEYLSKEDMQYLYTQIDPQIIAEQLKKWYELRSTYPWEPTIMDHLTEFTTTQLTTTTHWEIFLDKLLQLHKVKQTEILFGSDQFTQLYYTSQNKLEHELEDFINDHHHQLLQTTEVGHLTQEMQNSDLSRYMFTHEYRTAEPWISPPGLELIQRIKHLSVPRLIKKIEQASWFRALFQKTAHIRDVHYLVFERHYLNHPHQQFIFSHRVAELEKPLPLDQLATRLNLSEPEVMRIEYQLKLQLLHLILTNQLHAPHDDAPIYHLTALINHFSQRLQDKFRFIPKQIQAVTTWSKRLYNYSGTVDRNLLIALKQFERNHLISHVDWAIYLEMIRAVKPLAPAKIAEIWHTTTEHVEARHQQLYDELLETTFISNIEAPAAEATPDSSLSRIQALNNWTHTDPEIITAYAQLSPAKIIKILSLKKWLKPYLPPSFQLTTEHYVNFESSGLTDPLSRQIFLEQVLKMPTQASDGSDEVLALIHHTDMAQVAATRTKLKLHFLHQLALPSSPLPFDAATIQTFSEPDIQTLTHVYRDVLTHQHQSSSPSISPIYQMASTLGFLTPATPTNPSPSLIADLKDFETHTLLDPISWHIYLNLITQSPPQQISQLWPTDALDLAATQAAIKDQLIAILADHFTSESAPQPRQVSRQLNHAHNLGEAAHEFSSRHPSEFITAIQAQSWFQRESELRIPITVGQYLGFENHYLNTQINADFFLAHLAKLPSSHASYEALATKHNLPFTKAIWRTRHLRYFWLHFLTTGTRLNFNQDLPPQAKVLPLIKHYHQRLLHIHSPHNQRLQTYLKLDQQFNVELTPSQTLYDDIQAFEATYLTAEHHWHIYFNHILNQQPLEKLEDISFIWNISLNDVLSDYSDFSSAIAAILAKQAK